MKKFLFFIVSILLMTSFFYVKIIARNFEPKSQIKKGRYLPTAIITPEVLDTLPYPSSSENYAFIQSIGKVTNIVIGEFRDGNNKITLITDKNADGKVDQITYYYFATGKYRKQPKPEKMYSPEKFKQLKLDIINGVRSDVSPNSEGVPYIKSKVKNESINTKIYRKHHGYQVSVNDADNIHRNRLNFLFSNNGIHGFDLAFEVKYYNVKGILIKPVIMFTVYCKKSYDPLVKEVTKDLITYTSQYHLQ